MGREHDKHNMPYFEMTKIKIFVDFQGPVLL